MTTTNKKYYISVPQEFRQNGEPSWKELREVKNIIAEPKTLTAAQRYVDHVFGGDIEPEIAVSINGGDKTVVSKKDKAGQWTVISQTNSYYRR